MNDLSASSILIALLFWGSVGGFSTRTLAIQFLFFYLPKLSTKPEAYQIYQPSVTLLIAAY